MAQERVHKRSAEQKHDAYAEPSAKADADTKQALKDRMDELLDEVDEVLEENAEQFVKSYVQQPGQ